MKNRTLDPRDLPPTILLAEDEGTVRSFARRVLEGAGFRVLEAPDGVEALRQFEEHGALIDVVLMDVVMPYMGVPELARHLRMRGVNPHAVMMSGHPDDVVVAALCQDSGTPLIRKPFSPGQLLATVAEVLREELIS